MGLKRGPIRPFTDKEQQVLALLARGMIDKDIGVELGIAYRSAHHRVERAFDKLGGRTRFESGMLYEQMLCAERQRAVERRCVVSGPELVDALIGDST